MDSPIFWNPINEIVKYYLNSYVGDKRGGKKTNNVLVIKNMQQKLPSDMRIKTVQVFGKVTS